MSNINPDPGEDKFDFTGSFYDGIDTMRPDGAPHDGSPASSDESAKDGWRAVEVPANETPFRRGRVTHLDGGLEQ